VNKEFEQWIDKMKLRQWLQALSPVLAPIVVFGLWLGFAKLDKRADALSKLIAIAEPIPTVDLNLPKPVVLASLYHSVDEALDVIGDVMKFLQSIEVPNAEKIVKDIKKELEEAIIPDTPDDTKFNSDLLACYNNAKKNLPKLGFSQTAPPWIISCMLRKGYSISDVTKEVIQRKFF